MKSDREGMRIVIELKRDATGDVVLKPALPFHQSADQFSGLICSRWIKGRPRQMGFEGTCWSALSEFREEVILRAGAVLS